MIKVSMSKQPPSVVINIEGREPYIIRDFDELGDTILMLLFAQSEWRHTVDYEKRINGKL